MVEDKVHTVKIDESFKFDVASGHYETEQAWLELRIKPDPRRGDFYIDCLMGTKGREAHVHFGLNPDGGTRFFLPRDRLNSFERKAVDSIRGVLEDSKVMLKPEEGKHKATFTLFVDEPSRTIRVLFKDVKLESADEPASGSP